MMISAGKTQPVFKKGYLGMILLEHGLINSSQLKEGLQIQKSQGGFLGEILVDLGHIKDSDVVRGLVIQCHIPYIAVDRYDIDQNVIRLIPRDIARQHCVVPFALVNRILSVVMADPLDVDTKLDLQNITNYRLAFFVASQSEMKRAIRRWYGA